MNTLLIIILALVAVLVICALIVIIPLAILSHGHYKCPDCGEHMVYLGVKTPQGKLTGDQKLYYKCPKCGKVITK